MVFGIFFIQFIAYEILINVFYSIFCFWLE